MESTTTTQQGQVPDVPTMPAAKIRQMFESGENVRFVDARSEEDWNSSTEKLIGAIRYSQGHHLPALPKTWTIVTYCTCPHDEAARYLAQELIEKGHRAYAMEGGFNAWKNEGFPMDGKSS